MRRFQHSLILFFAFCLFVSNNIKAQVGLKIGANLGTKDPNAVLDLGVGNKGLLLPKVALTATSAASPLSEHVAGMAVYNTASVADVSPGYYYNNGTQWVRISTSGAGGLVSIPNLEITSTSSPVGSSVGQLVYNTNTASGLPNGLVVWDGSAWVAVNKSTSYSAGNGLSLVGGNVELGGTLSKATTITQGENNLTFSGSGSSQFRLNVPSFSMGGLGTFGIDAPNFVNGRFVILEGGNVGLGVASPTAKLHVSGNSLVSGNSSSGSSTVTGNSTVGGTIDVAGNRVAIRRSAAGEARYQLYNLGNSAEWLFGQKSGTSHDFTLSKLNGTTETDYLSVSVNGAVTMNNLGGSGTQMVVTDNNGTLSKQAIPVNTDAQILSLSGNTLSISGSNSSVTLPSSSVTGAANGLSLVSGNVELGGTLSKATTITQGENNLTFSGSGSSQFRLNVPSFSMGGLGTFGIDAPNFVNGRFVILESGNVGLGVSSPTEKLHVSGNSLVSGNSSIGGTASISGNATVGGSVGIGTTSPTAPLEVKGRILVDSIRINSGTSLTQGFSMGGNGVFGIDGPGSINGRFVVRNDGKVGIGASSPEEKFTIGGGNTEPIALSITNGVGKFRVGVSATTSHYGASVAGDVAIENNANAGLRFVTNSLPRMYLSNAGALQVSTLGGSGTQMVVADNNGVLSKQAIPADAQTLSLSGNTLSISGSNSSVTLPSSTYSAANGITLNGSAFELGGTLSKATTITQGENNLTFSGSGSSQFRLNVPSFSMGGLGTFGIDAPNFVNGRFVILESGNVGLGVASPTEKLHVSGNSLVSGNSSSGSSTVTGNSTVGGTIDVAGNRVAIRRSAAGEARYQLYNLGNSAEWLFGQKSGSSHDFTLSKLNGTTETDYLSVSVNGAVTMNNLGGSGTQMVVTDNNGTLSKQAIPVNTVYSASNGLTLNGSAFELGGTLSKATTITQGENNLTFSGSGSSQFRLNVPTFSMAGLGTFGIDAPNFVNGRFVILEGGNVGIGVASPTAKLHVSGNSLVSGNSSIGGTASISGNATIAGSVGIGTTSPAAPLEVKGRILVDSIRINSGTSLTQGFSMGGNGVFGIDAPGTINGRFVVTNSGNVGIGTASPTDRLTVSGGGISFNNSSSNGRLRSGSTGVLNLNVGSTSLNIDNNAGDANLMTILNSGKVGIGTSSPEEKFTIGGGTTEPIALSITNGVGKFRVGVSATTSHYGASVAGDVAIENNANAGLRFVTNSLPRMYLSNAGALQVSTLGGSGTQMVVADNNGVLSKQAIPADAQTLSLSGNTLSISGSNSSVTLPSSTYSAANGLTLNGSAFELGGTLSKATTITQGENNLTFSGSGSSQFRLNVPSFSMGGLGTFGIDAPNFVNGRFVILESGNVGLGVSSPTEKLHVSGNSLVSGNSSSGSSTVTGNSTVGGTIDVAGNRVAIRRSAAGEARYQLYNLGNSAEWLFGQKSGTSHDFTLSKLNGTTEVDYLSVSVNGAVTMNNLGGSGTQMVVTDNNGTLSKQAIPVNTVYSASNGLTLNGSAFELGGTLSKATTITQGENNLTFSGSGSSQFRLNVPSFSMGGLGTFGIDAPNFVNGRFVILESGNVGLGVSSPTEKLHVSGNSLVSGNSSIGGTASISGNATVGGSVGIGTTSPTAPLEVKGRILVDSIRINSGTSLTQGFSMGGNGVFGIDGPGSINGRFVVRNDGKVGIGASSPEEKFTIGGGNTEPIALSITNGVGKFRVGVSATTSHYGASVAGDVAIENNANAGLRFVTNSLPRMYLSNAGALQVSTLGGSGTQMVVADNNGVLSKQAIPADAQTLSLSGNTLSISGSNSSVTLPSSTYSAANGITLNGSAFELGGTLSKATTITQGENNLTFSGSGSSQFRLNVPSFSMGGLGTFGIDAPNFVNGRFVILESGNVGLGVASPTEKLHVSGNSLVSGNSSSGSSTVTGNSTVGGTIDVAGNRVAIRRSAAGEARYQLYNLGNSAEWLFGQKSGTSHDFTLSKLNGTTETDYLSVSVNGAVTMNNLGGSGTQMVVTDNNGTLSKQAIPVNTVYSASNGLTLNGSAFELGGTLSKATTITQGENNLTFSGSGSSQFRLNVPSFSMGGLGTFGIDAPNFVNGRFVILESGNVGLGVSSPTEKLHVSGNSLVSGNSSIGGTASISGNATVGGSVGIGTTSPAAPLEVKGRILVDSIRINSGTSLTQGFSMGGNGVFGIDGPGSINGRFVVRNDGKVGIGASSPEEKFTIGGGNTEPIALSITNGVGKFRVGVSATTSHYGASVAGDVAIENNANAGLRFVTNSLPRMYLSNAGALQVSTLGGSGTQMVVADNNGVLSKQAIPADAQTLSLSGNTLSISGSNSSVTLPSSTYSAANGITLNGSAFELGGTLSKATTITQGENNLTFSGSGSSQFRLNVPSFSMGGLGTFGIDAPNFVNGRFVILESGNVGLGVASPTEKLHVSGNSLVSGNSSSGSSTVTGNSTVGGTIDVAGNRVAIRRSAAGEARYQLYNLGNSAEWLFGQKSGTSHDFTLSKLNGTTETDYLSVSVNGAVTMNNLGGSGTQMVVTDNNGTLSKQAIPVNTVYSASNGLTLNGSAFELGGTLSKATTITQGENNLTFSGSGSSQFRLNVPSFSMGGLGTFGIDAPNFVNGRFVILESGNVGLGVSSPTEKLHVSGNSLVSGNSSIGGTASISGNATVGGSVGIGTTSPAAPLEVKGRILVDSIRINSGTSLTQGFSMGGNGVFGIDAPGTINGRFVVTNSGNVGIGTASPTDRLTVSGGGISFNNSSSNGRLRSGSTGVLNLNVGSTSLNIDNNAGDANLMTILNSGKVGIGTSSPEEKFTIGGGTTEPIALSITNGVGKFRVGVSATTSHYGASVAGDVAIENNANAGLRFVTNSLPRMYLSNAGALQVSTLGGSGTQMVVADNNGVLSKQTIPADAQTLSLSGNTLSISGSNSSVTLPSSSVTGAANGLSLVSGNVELGGTLSKATTITQGENNLTFSGSGSSQFRLNVPSFSMGGLGTFGIDAPNFVNGRFVILEGGNVGIGVASPTAKLHVSGNSLVSGNSSSGSSTVTGNSIVGGTIDVAGNRVAIRRSAAGEARYQLYNLGNSAEWLFGQKSGSSHDFTLSKLNGTTESDYLSVSVNGAVTMNNLGGSGTQMVVTDNNGTLSKQTIPADVQTLSLSGNTLSISGSNSSVTLPSSSVTGAANGLSLVSGNVELGGTLSKATTITQGENNLTFSGSGSSQFRLNVPTFSMAGLGTFGIDAPNFVNGRFVILEGGNVGIGVASPTEKLHVSGNSLVSGNSSIGGTASISGNATVGGSVGIGTTSPAAPLEVKGRILVDSIRINSGTSLTQGFSMGGNGVFGIDAPGTINGRFVVTNAGNVGIGTASPTDRLTVSGGGISFNGNSSNGRLRSGSTGVLNLNVGSTSFNIDNNAANANLMTILNSGNVGIGTGSPTEKLHVSGNSLVSGNSSIGGTASITSNLSVGGTSTVSGNESIGGTLGVAGNRVAIRRSAAGEARYQLYNLGNSAEWLFGQKSGSSHDFTLSKLNGTTETDYLTVSTSGELRLNSTSTSQVFSMGGTGIFGIDAPSFVNGRFVVTNAGNVGIGTNVPSSKLQVEGNTFVNGSITTSNASGSGVFWMNSSAGAYGVPNTGELLIQTPGKKGISFGVNVNTASNGTDLVSTTRSVLYLSSEGRVVIGSTPRDTSNTANVTIGGGLALYTPRPGSPFYQSGIGGAQGGMLEAIPSDVDGFQGLRLYANRLNGYIDFATNPQTNVRTTRMRIANNGFVGINTVEPSYNLHVNGSVAGTSAYVNLSDARLKTNVKNLTGSLDKVMQLRGVTFDWNNQADTTMKLDDQNHIGFIAQEIEKILPQVVTTAKDERQTKSVAYSDVVPVLVEAIKELKAENDRLKTQVSELDALKAEVSAIKAMLVTPTGTNTQNTRK